MLRTPRVAIVGSGFVGSTTAYALLTSDFPAEIVLIDRDRRRAEGHVHDVRDAEVFSYKTRVLAGEFGDCCSADVAIITTGVSQAGLKSRLDGLKEIADIVHGRVHDVAKHNPRGILLIASNPVDVLTYAAWKWSGLPPNRVIGSGTVLDTARFRRRLAERYKIASNNIHALVLGEHRDSEVTGIPLEEFCQQLGLPYEGNTVGRIARETRAAGLQIIGAKGATYYGIGAVLVRSVRAILRDENSIFTVSGLVPESMQLGQVSCLFRPSSTGMESLPSTPLNASERQALEASAEILKGRIALLDSSVSITAREAESFQYQT